MKIISFNVNGLRSAISKGFIPWLAETNPDVICLQEIKMEQPESLQAHFAGLGYQGYWMPARKKGYSGVGILTKITPDGVKLGCDCELYDCEGRVIQLQFGAITLINTYMPSGSSGLERQFFKMQWLDFFYNYINLLKTRQPNLVICGDYNICHQAIDIHNPVSNAKSSGFLPEEREWITKFLQLGFLDTFRHLNPEARHQYTWWSYRAHCRNKNLGWRIDHHLVSEPLRENLKMRIFLAKSGFPIIVPSSLNCMSKFGLPKNSPIIFMSKNYAFYLLLSLSVLVSCNKHTSNDNLPVSSKEAKGGRVYGGVFRLSEAEYIKTLYPPNITDAFSYRVASQVYEGLFKFNPVTLEVMPCLAESYLIDKNHKVYTFKLKKGVFFHNDACFEGGKGRELTAKDIQYCFTQLCTQSPTNQNFSLFKDILKGANQYFEATANGQQPAFEVEGIKVVDKYTIQLILEKPSSILFYNLARPGSFIYPKEAVEKYKADMRIKTVGTGPFRLTDVEENISMILKRHDRYHGTDSLGNQLPFLQALSIQFIKDKKTELFEFKKGNLDMLYRLPTEYIIEILEEMSKKTEGGEYSQYELQREPEMVTQMLAFHTQQGPFKDINVRKAFSFAIDREKILESVLNGEGFAPGLHGITPPAFKNYTIDKIKGFMQHEDSGRYYLAKAGFPNGKGFPATTLYLNAEGSRNTNVAVEVQKQLQDNLNITVELSVLPLAQSVEKAISGDFQFLRIAWRADYPSAENFLWLFNGKAVPADIQAKSFPNIFRYKNDAFDRFYKSALEAKSIDEANGYFMQAEQVLMNDAPMIVLWYDEGYRLIQSYVKNFANNPMQYRDLSQVWFDPVKVKQQQ